MLTTKVRIQVTAIIAVALVGVAYVGARYAGLDSVIGGPDRVVHLQLRDSGGLFTHAEVTYRGMAAGRVGQMRLIDGGIEVDLRIDSGAPDIPADVEAVVANKSAVGEQYVDLRPRSDDGPYLESGDVIGQRDTSLPLSVEQVLLSLDRLIQSVPTDDLRVVVDEMYLATRDAGPHLQALLDATATFTEQADDHLAETIGLITNAETVLDTQIDLSASIQDFGRNAKLIAEVLSDSDADLREILVSAPGLASEVTQLMADAGEPLGSLLTHLLTASEVASLRLNSLDSLLALTPQVVSVASAAIDEDGASFGLVTTFFDPLPCIYGSTKYRNGLDTSPAPLNTAAAC